MALSSSRVYEIFSEYGNGFNVVFMAFPFALTAAVALSGFFLQEKHSNEVKVRFFHNAAYVFMTLRRCVYFMCQ